MYDDYYAYADFVQFPRAERAFVRALIRCLSLPPGAHVVDLGCGTEKYAALFAAEGMRTVGVDFSRVGVARARQTHPAASFVVGDARRLPFGLESCDVVFCSGLSLFNEAQLDVLDGFLADVFAMLKPAGRFVFVKTTSLTERPSKRNSRYDHGLDQFVALFQRVPGAIVEGAYATFPQLFQLGERMSLSKMCTQVSVRVTQALRVPLRAYIIVRKEAHGYDG